MPQYNLKFTGQADQLPSCLAQAVCDMYTQMAGGTGPDGTPYDLGPLNNHLAKLGLVVEPAKAPQLVDITPQASA